MDTGTLQVIVTQSHGTEALVHLLINACNQEGIIDPVISALCHLTSGHVHAEIARNVVMTHGGITALATILKSPMVQQSLIKV